MWSEFTGVVYTKVYNMLHLQISFLLNKTSGYVNVILVLLVQAEPMPGSTYGNTARVTPMKLNHCVQWVDPGTNITPYQVRKVLENEKDYF